ncbi:MAG: hypothetical protein Q9179_000880 [Wetmoreana sp. 5 TL-2023]
MSAGQDHIPPPPEGSERETKYEVNDKVWYYRNKKWRKGKVLKGESSNTRYAESDKIRDSVLVVITPFKTASSNNPSLIDHCVSKLHV